MRPKKGLCGLRTKVSRHDGIDQFWFCVNCVHKAEAELKAGRDMCGVQARQSALEAKEKKAIDLAERQARAQARKAKFCYCNQMVFFH